MAELLLLFFFWSWVVAGLLYWGGGGYFTWLLARSPRIGPGHPGAGGDPPPVLVLVPARNEERAIERCLRSLLAQDYPKLRIVVADDGSTDRTREIAERIAADDERLEVISPGELPPGWIGKCWALHRAYEAAREGGCADGSLLLFTDADVQFHPRAVSIGVGILEEEKLDLCALLPRVRNGSFWERTIMPAVIHGLMIFGAVSDRFPARDYPRMASGAYLLVRPEAYRRAGGHRALRGEIIEDVALATTIHQRGGRTAARMAPELLCLRMYHGLQEIWRGWAKNTFAGTDDNLRRAAEVFLILVAFSVLPGILFPALVGTTLAGATGWPLALGAALLWGAMTAVRLAGSRLTGDPPAYVLLHPLAGAFMAAVFTASVWSRRFGRGALWRGRRYPI